MNLAKTKLVNWLCQWTCIHEEKSIGCIRFSAWSQGSFSTYQSQYVLAFVPDIFFKTVVGFEILQIPIKIMRFGNTSNATYQFNSKR